jgi:ADP-heptose:LPS heptosyltransferase
MTNTWKGNGGPAPESRRTQVPVPVPSLLQPHGPLIPDVHRIAVVRANSIGDFVLALPALAALRAAFPAARITYLGEPWHPQLLDGRPGPWDEVVVVPPYPGVRGGSEELRDSPEVSAFLTRQRRERYDLAVQLHGGGANSNPFVRALGAGVTVGARATDAPPLDRWLPYTDTQHEILRCLEVVGLVGAPPVGLEPRLTPTVEDAAAAEAVLPTGTGPVVAVHPGAHDPRRRWPPERFGAVADALACHGATVVLVGSGDDDQRAAAAVTAAMTGEPVDLVGRLSLAALAGILHRCRLVVANDSGPRHLAEALGTATVGIFLERNLVNAGPLTRRRHRVAVSSRTACPVCRRDQNGSRCPHDPPFVDDVGVDEVMAESVDLLASTRPDAADVAG